MFTMDWQSLIPLFGVLVVAIAAFIASTQKYFTIREHIEFKDKVEREVDIALSNVTRELDLIRTLLVREFDQIRHDIARLEDTRPTTGELQARLPPKRQPEN